MLQALVAAQPMRTLLPATFALSFLGLSLTPSFISLISLLASLLLYTRGTLGQTGPGLRIAAIWATLTVSISISHFAPTIHALSTPLTSIASLILLSGLSSAIALVPICLSRYVKLGGHLQPLVFPSLWATMWLFISWLSPLGRLITWSPLSGIDSYRWIRGLLGFVGIDWIAAAWANVAAETIGDIIFKPKHEEDLLIDVNTDNARKPTPKDARHPIFLTGVLLVLTVPSFFSNTLPLRPISPDSTPLTVACVLPKDSQNSPLENFLIETAKHAASAKILLWPEGAVVFETEADRKHALEQVHNIAWKSKVWIGVSFEEKVFGTGSNTREGLRRNGMVLVGPKGVEMNYYKRRLVPIAESFSQIASNEPPPIHTIDLPHPKDVPAHEWSPSGTRGIPLSASICLDFSTPLTSLESRPALILAPAKTWHVGVGRAMYELARARADEIGSDVLWCDGGAGGLSGVAGNVQVGKGTWVQTIGVPFPADSDSQTRRTLYGAGGDWLALAATLGLSVLIWAARRSVDVERVVWQAGEPAIAWTRDRTREVISRIRGVGSTRTLPQEQSLIDDT